MQDGRHVVLIHKVFGHWQVVAEHLDKVESVSYYEAEIRGLKRIEIDDWPADQRYAPDKNSKNKPDLVS